MEETKETNTLIWHENEREFQNPLPNKIRTNDDIFVAVKLWLSNKNEALKKYGDISRWDTSRVTDMSSLFDISRFDNNEIKDNVKTFNDDIGNWDVSNVKFMISMFYGCSSFNQDLNKWNVANVVDMNTMFAECKSFNGKIGNWKVSKLENIDSTFQGCLKFNQDIGSWDVKSVLNCKSTFLGCTIFNNGDSDSIKTWDMSANQSGKDFSKMFNNCEKFNQDIRSWKMPPDNTEVAINLNNMFDGASKFLTTYKDYPGWKDFNEGTPSLNFFNDDSKPVIPDLEVEEESDNNSESSSSSSESSNSEKVKGLTKKYIEVINGSNLSESQKKMAVGALIVLYALTGVAVADSAATDVIRGLRILRTGDCKSLINYKYPGEEIIPCNLKAILIILRGVGVGSILPNIINDIVELTVKPTVESDELGVYKWKGLP
jgi:surface protein